MAVSAPVAATARPASNAFLKLLVIASLLFGAVGFSAALYYRSHRIWVQTAKNDDTLKEKFIAAYYAGNAWNETHWLGVRSDQTPTDNWQMQQIISELKPDYIIETGTLYGGTTAFYADVLGQVNPNGKVITIDIEPQVTDAAKLKSWQERVELITASSVDPKMTAELAQRVAGKKVLVTLDSMHTRDHVLKELEIYGPMVSVGSYVVVQDTNVNGHPVLPDWGPGPMEAVQDFLKTHDNFVPDSNREKFMLTFYPGGWLKKVK
jgi:cephalosporin hydroxylase